MTRPNPALFHITHVDNLDSVARDGLLSDAEMIRRGGPAGSIGMTGIKQRRLARPVKGQHQLMVGACVPFYFCPRSVMLYLIYRGNHPGLAYRGGQRPIVHLVSNVRAVVDHAAERGLRWAFTLSNAAAYYAEFRHDLDHLADIDWEAVNATDFRSADVKESKQAEFLVEAICPWALITHIVVIDQAMREHVEQLLEAHEHRPLVRVKPSWYY